MLGIRLRPRHALEALAAERLERLLTTQPAGLGEERGREDDPMAEHRQEQQLDVFGAHVVASLDERPGAADPLECEARTNRSAQRDALERPRGGDELDDPAEQELVGIDEVERLLELGDVLEVDDGLKPGDRVRLALAPDDLDLLVDGRIAERDLEREAVELCLGEQEGSLLLDRVLRREEQERVGQLSA